ncbi:uncharacterized protein LOC117109171, partial [Anneissia japonica]|uniref:uncharacterized protein LOC117109171 n=1 Tax=Anneissia japonica TaxID=1529436 RepID=UPI0014256AA2
HGKGPCDGEIGVVKKCANTAVRSRRFIIANAHDLFNFCKETLSLPKEEDHVHMRRRFFYVKNGEVNREERERSTNIRPLQNTRSSHSFSGIEPYFIGVKERSCFCNICMGTSDEACPNTKFTGQLCLTSLRSGKIKRTSAPTSQPKQIDEVTVSVLSIQTDSTQSTQEISAHTKLDEEFAAP